MKSEHVKSEHAPENAHEQEQSNEAMKPKRVFLEVGTYQTPVTVFGDKKFGKDDLYIGLDIDEHEVRSAKRNSEWRDEDDGRQTGEHKLFMNADMRRMPIADKSVEELFLGNVLGDPSISDKQKERLLSEAARILKDKRTLVIKETNTPASRDKVKQLLADYGFSVERMINPEDNEWKKEIALYNKSQATRPYWDSYIMYAH